MTIYNRQYQKILSIEVLKHLLSGRLPNLNDISTKISKALSDRTNITFKYIPQEYKGVFNVDNYNKSLRQIKFDIDLFHEELLDLFAQSSTRLNFADLYHKINSYELSKLEAQLNLLLFTVADADFYFDGFFDTFADISNLNTEESTKDIIDLSEQCISLPYGGKNTRRINVGSLMSMNDIDVKVVGDRAQSVISLNKIPNTKFGDIFSDVLSVWGYEIITSEEGPLELEFSFPLNPDGNIESEFFVTRFEVTPHSDGPQRVVVSTSNDDVNYIKVIGYENGLVTKDQKVTYAIDFETTLVQYVKLNISKDKSDEEIVANDRTNYRYIIGLKRFAAYQTGRLTKATYQSKPLSFKSTDTIGKVAIYSDELVPAGCSINYSIAGVTNGSLSSFIPITPVSKSSALGKSQVVSFNTVIKDSTEFTTQTSGDDAPQIYGTSFQGKNFYRVGPALTERPIFGSSVLYRGFKSWYRDSSGSFDILRVDDNYVTFEHTDLEAMYALETESPSITPLGLVGGVRKVKLAVTKTPYYDSSRGHNLKPQPGTQNSLLDIRPNYAIYKVRHKTSTSRKSAQFTLSSARTQYLPITNFILQTTTAADLPRLSSVSGQQYTVGVDFNYELEDIGGQNRPTGRIEIPDGSAFLDTNNSVQPISMVFSYKIDPDITHKVSRIDGTTITLDNCSITQYDSVEITYRYIPVAPSSIIKSSIRVANLPSSSPTRIYYQEGRDYVIDATTGAIQRIPTGTIPNSGAAYIQFSYRNSSSNLQTFTTWCYLPKTEGTQIKFDLDETTKKNKLIVDTELGETFYVNSKEGVINLTKATTTPVLPNGWVQFIVRSKNPDLYGDYKTNLIDQVIQLKDVNKKKIFKQYSYYFDQITAFREPLEEKSLNHLKVNTLLSDHSVFAIDSTTDPFNSYVVLNFSPNNTDELYCKVPTEDSDETNPPQTSNESFTLSWSEETNQEIAPTEIVVKIELNRNQTVDDALSPKVFSYQLRVGS